MPLRIHAAGPRAGLFAPEASGFQRHVLLDAVLGPLLCPGESAARCLIDSWHSSDDLRTWTFRLRPGIKFHNGREAAARDLVFTLSHILACAFETPDKSLLRNVAAGGVSAVDERTVKVLLVEPDPYFALLIKDSFFSIVPREELRPSGSGLTGPSPNSGSHLSWKRHPVGAGPYRVIRTSKDGAEVEVEAAREIPEDSPKRIIFTTGECDPETDLALGFTVNPQPGRLEKTLVDTPFAIMGLYFNFSHPWARNPLFREAVASAIDAAAVSALIEDARPAHGMIPSNFLKKLSRKPALISRFDPRRAAALFKTALGAVPTAPIDIPVGGRFVDGKLPAWLAEIEGQLNRAGLPVRMTPGKGDAPLIVAGFIPGIADLGQLFSLFREGTGWVSRLDERDALYEDLLKKAAATRDEESREEVIGALFDRFTERAYAVPLYEEPVVLWTNPKRVKSVDAERQGISLAYERLKVAR